MSDAGLLSRLEAVAHQYDELQAEASLPETSTDPAAIRRLGKELSRLEPVVSAYRELVETTDELAGAREMRDSDTDEELRAMARDEVSRLEDRETGLVAALKLLLLPRDPSDEKDVILEIRQGAGGDEAALFARELLRMYLRYAERHRFAAEILVQNENGIGGIKEAIVDISGDGAYSRLKFEGGTHRVQRIPATESSGRIHTSTATVVVLPKVEPTEIEIDEERDLRIEVKRSSGPGWPVGQYDRLGGPDHPHPVGPGGRDPGREEPAQEQGQGAGRPACPSPGRREAEAARGELVRPPLNGRVRRSVGQDPDLQLSPGPGLGPPGEPELVEPARNPRWRPGSPD